MNVYLNILNPQNLIGAIKFFLIADQIKQPTYFSFLFSHLLFSRLL